jgi:hypothetical protein
MTFMAVRDTIRLPGPGFCIYCGSNGPLSDEHVLPLGLGGRLILPEASCQACSQITSAFERKVLRGFMRPARITANFPTRRKKERPKSRAVTLLRGATPQAVTGLSAAVPALLQLPTLATAGILTGVDGTRGVNVVGIETTAFGPRPDEFVLEHSATGFRQSDDLDVTAFARMLAKIGYSYLVGALGPMPLPEVTVLPLILGSADDGSHWLGSAAFSTEAEAQGAQHVLRPQYYESSQPSAPRLLGAQIKLFANVGATGYEVIVRKMPESAA